MYIIIFICIYSLPTTALVHNCLADTLYIMCLNLFYKSEGIDEVDKQRLRLVKRVMGGTGGKNPPSSKEKPVKETFIPPELSMVTFFMTKVRDVFTKHILDSQFCYHLFIKFFTILSHANFFTFSDYN